MAASYVREIFLGKILKPSVVLEDMTNRTKRSAIEELINLLYKQELITNKSEAFERVMERESLVSTGLGNGVAIPHARLEVGDKPIIALGRHKTGVEFDAADGEPVYLILLVLWKPEQPGLFNRLFAGLVSKLADDDFRKKLFDAKNAEEIVRQFDDVRVDMHAGLATKCEADMLITLQLLEAKRRAGTKGLEKQIALARDELPGSVLSRFDRLIDRWGEALVEAPEGVCHGCSMHLSSSFASEMLKNPDTIYVCDRCGRFIIHHIV